MSRSFVPGYSMSAPTRLFRAELFGAILFVLLGLQFSLIPQASGADALPRSNSLPIFPNAST
jgi:hypothetical protein